MRKNEGIAAVTVCAGVGAASIEAIAVRECGAFHTYADSSALG